MNYKMRIGTLLGEILPVLGTIGLLGLWTFQQTGIEERASELRKLTSARSVYQTYQSNNALFNAIVETANGESDKIEAIRKFQLYNYELGLHGIEDSLPNPDRKDIPTGAFAYDPSMPIEEKMRITQERLEKLQDRLGKRQVSISLEASSAKRLYLWLYLALSVMMIFGAILKAVDKLNPQTHRPDKSAQPPG